MTNAAQPNARDRLVVAIDGPSGVGKSTTARGVAKRLGLRYLDTGAMYRAVCIMYRELGLAPGQGEETAAAIAEHDFVFSTDVNDQTIRYDGRDITDEIRRPEIGAVVSQVATMIPVRHVLQQLQRDAIMADENGIVLEGRDMTTVVAPDADVRVLLVADPAIRMRRRELEIAGLTPEQITDQIVRRDRDDSTVAEFHTPASGVTLIDSTHMTLDEVISAIVDLADRG